VSVVILNQDVSFSCVYPVIDYEFRHEFVKIVLVADYLNNVMTKFIVLQYQSVKLSASALCVNVIQIRNSCVCPLIDN